MLLLAGQFPHLLFGLLLDVVHDLLYARGQPVAVVCARRLPSPLPTLSCEAARLRRRRRVLCVVAPGPASAGLQEVVEVVEGEVRSHQVQEELPGVEAEPTGEGGGAEEAGEGGGGGGHLHLTPGGLPEGGLHHLLPAGGDLVVRGEVEEEPRRGGEGGGGEEEGGGGEGDGVPAEEADHGLPGVGGPGGVHAAPLLAQYCTSAVVTGSNVPPLTFHFLHLSTNQ